MSILFVNGSSGADDSGDFDLESLSSAAQSVSAGNALVVGLVLLAGVGGATSVTDTAGNTFTKMGDTLSLNSWNIEFWIAHNILAHASNVVTAEFPECGYPRIGVLQLSGVAASGAHDTAFAPSGNQDDTSPFTTTAANTAVNGEWIIGIFTGTEIGSYSNSLPSIVRLNISDYSPDTCMVTREMTSAGSGSVSAVLDDVSGITCYSKAIKPASNTVTVFNSSGTFTPTETGVVEVLVIGGGGGGGRNGGGGGGAGGVRFTTYAVTKDVGVTVTVGNGGAGAVDNTHPGSNGGDSSFGTITATGGGGGGSRDGGGGGVAGGAGGGGGGAGGSNSNAYGAGTSGQGWNGGNGTALDLGVDAAGGGGGGGGAKGGSAGYAGASQVAGNGGSGSTYSITGIDVVYAGGGGGGRTTQDSTRGTGGSGGGGNGGGSSTAATNGAANKGAGGGGGGSGSTDAPGNGGSGVVIVCKKTPTFSRASNTIIDKGIQITTWIPNTNSGRGVLSAQQFADHKLTGVTYYEGDSSDDLWNSTFHSNVPTAQWGMAKAPVPDDSSLDDIPNNNNWFSATQQAKASDCVAICFGDEQAYSANMATYFKNWTDLTHSYYDHIICHSNQFVGQWSDSDLDAFIDTAHPDMLTFDNYIFDTAGNQPDWKVPSFALYNINLQHRDRALRGWDGTYTSPIIWGQYLLNFKPGDEQWKTEGTYVITESQKYLVAMVSVALGAKWLSLFLTEKNSEVWSITFTDAGVKTTHFDQYAELFRQIRNLGPHLVRLHSTGYATEPGDHMVTGNPTENSPVYNRFSANSTYFLKSVSAENLGSNNDDLPGDVIIGYFSKLPGYTGSFFTCSDPKYFMVVNGLTHGNGLTVANQHGAGSENQQKITITFDMTGGDITKLRKVSRDTGNVEAVTLTHVSGNDYKIEPTLDGGVGELYFWESGIAGTTCWGHDTGVTETNIRNFAMNWVGTGAVENTGDNERLVLASGEYMESEIINTGTQTVEILQNKYQSGDNRTLYYKTGNSLTACEAASWTTYTVPFASSGFVKIKIEG